MSTTCKSPRRVLQVAYAVAKSALPAYGHRCSPRKFTQHQLMACLVLKAFRRLDYRGLAAELIDNPGYCALIELTKVPHFTTFQKAERRLLRVSAAAKLLTATIGQAVASKIMRRRVELGAVDSAGFESRHISAYFVKRRKRCKPGYETTTYTRYPKAGILCDCRSHLILAVVPGRGNSSRSRASVASLSYTGTRLLSKRPSFWASAARFWLSAAKASRSSRLKPSSVAIRSAEMPWGTSGCCSPRCGL